MTSGISVEGKAAVVPPDCTRWPVRLDTAQLSRQVDLSCAAVVVVVRVG